MLSIFWLPPRHKEPKYPHLQRHPCQIHFTLHKSDIPVQLPFTKLFPIRFECWWKLFKTTISRLMCTIERYSALHDFYANVYNRKEFGMVLQNTIAAVFLIWEGTLRPKPWTTLQCIKFTPDGNWLQFSWTSQEMLQSWQESRSTGMKVKLQHNCSLHVAEHCCPLLQGWCSV